jgi:hypothetical protein
MKAKRKMSEEGVDATHRAPRAVSRTRQMGDADKSARTVVKCGRCYKARRITSEKAPFWSSPPPLWLLENLWLLKSYSLCQKCIDHNVRRRRLGAGGCGLREVASARNRASVETDCAGRPTSSDKGSCEADELFGADGDARCEDGTVSVHV